MKKLLGTTAASAIAAVAIAGAASADNYVYWNTYKDKYVDIFVTTYKNFDIWVDVELEYDATGSAQASSLVNSLIAGNSVDGYDGVFDMDMNRKASMNESMNYNRGIGQVNQDAGNFNNQGNTASVAWNKNGADVTMAEAYAEQNTVYNRARHSESFPAPASNPDIASSLTYSLLNNTGVFHFNQGAGNGNAQHNVLALAIGSDSVVALSDAGLAQDNIGNSIAEFNSVKQDRIADSVNGNTGLVNVNQSSGNFNNQATVYSVAVLSSSVGLGQ